MTVYKNRGMTWLGRACFYTYSLVTGGCGVLKCLVTGGCGVLPTKTPAVGTHQYRCLRCSVIVAALLVAAGYFVIRWLDWSAHVRVVIPTAVKWSQFVDIQRSNERKGDAVQSYATKNNQAEWYAEPPPCDVIPVKSTLELVNFVRNITFNCKNLTLFGGSSLSFGKYAMHYDVDGQKWVCLPPPLESTRTRELKPSMRPEKCIVYSFGINNQWNFDDDVANYGCQVYSFDPTMGVADFDRSDRVHFFDLGIANFTGRMDISRKSSKVSRLEEIRSRLGHYSSVIDYLKVDVEGSELIMIDDLWRTSSYILKDYVAQIGMEIHLSEANKSIVNLSTRRQLFWRLLRHLDCLGFRIVYQEPNTLFVGDLEDGQPLACCFEIVWVNRAFF